MHAILLSICLAPCLVAPQAPAAVPPEAPGAAFDVVVRDAAGKPLRGAPIGLGRKARPSERLATGLVTDKQGRCRVVVDPGKGLGRDVVVTVLGAFSRPSTAEIDTLLPPAAPVELVVPPCGQVRFILYGRDEKPFPGLTAAALALADDEHTVEALELGADSALLPWVELGREVVVTAHCTAVAGPLRFRSPGPTRAGEFRIAEGRLGQGPAIAALTLVDGDGRPVAGERVGVCLRGDGVHVQVEHETAADGGLLVALGESAAAARTLRIVRCGPGPLRASRGAAVVQLAAPATGVLELGRVQLAAEPVVLRGRVVDPDGRALGGIVLRTALSFASRSDLPAFVHRVATAADGSFELLEREPGTGELCFEVESDAWGEQGLLRAQIGGPPPVFALRPKGTLALALAGARAGLRLDVRFVHRQTGKTTYARLVDGALAPWSLLAGTYDVTLGDHGVEFVLRGVEVPAGGPSTDPRLAAVEPDGALQIVRAHVQDDRGVPVADVAVWCKAEAGARTGRAATTDPQGRVVFLAPRGAGVVAIQELGFEPVAMPITDGDVALRLQRVPPLAVRIAGLPALPEGIRWRAVFLCQGPTPAAAGHAWIEDGVARFQPERLGTWRMTLEADGAPTHDLRVIRRLADVRLGLRLQFDVQAKAVPGGPENVALSDDERNDAEQHVAKLREILGEGKDD